MIRKNFVKQVYYKLEFSEKPLSDPRLIGVCERFPEQATHHGLSPHGQQQYAEADQLLSSR